ncbi:phospholipase D family protein [Variovorax sp. PAMC 28711]|uniref:phospholipase D family protein n=1 Tax=Variovorax sp. PAMC 28711 TaxID=1795631 RepID=UPI00078E6CC0|nr:phospholipase D family protein [Variovorax sp. PAMC 28711]AMM24652.1 phospholipase [Variovorax sp. PAMC 28711]
MRREVVRTGLLLLAVAAAGCASLAPPVASVPTRALSDVAQTPLARIAAAGASEQAPGASGFRLLPEASFAFDARIALVRKAERSLDVQYYLIQNDDVGLQLLRELRDAAARGVRVRLLVDDFYTAGEDELLATLAAFPNVEVRLFNPLPWRAGSLEMRVLFSLNEFSRINHRMHNKLLVADNSFAVSGGRNIANDYFMRSTSANFIDVDILSSGPIVPRMSEGFDRYWNSAQVRPVGGVVQGAPKGEAAQRRFDHLAARAAPDVPVRERDVLGRTPLTAQLAEGVVERDWGHAELFVDDPAKITRAADEAIRGSVTEGALTALNSARAGVLIVSPYFIPNERGLAMMQTAVAHGGHIKIVTNSLGSTDEPLAYAGYARSRAAMLRAGIELRELGAGLASCSGRFGDFGQSISRMHAKLAVIDDKRLFIGSMNLDRRSAVVNTEAALLIDSPTLVARFLSLSSGDRFNAAYRLRLNPATGAVEWLEDGADGQDVVHTDEPGGQYGTRLKNWLLLPIVGTDLL